MSYEQKLWWKLRIKKFLKFFYFQEKVDNFHNFQQNQLASSLFESPLNFLQYTLSLFWFTNLFGRYEGQSEKTELWKIWYQFARMALAPTIQHWFHSLFAPATIQPCPVICTIGRYQITYRLEVMGRWSGLVRRNGFAQNTDFS